MTEYVDAMRDIAVLALEDIKGKEIQVLDTTTLTDLFDCMIVATGESNRQVRALANNVAVELKAKGYEILSTEGEETGDWVLVDAGSLIVHVMLPAVRDYYDLEQLWGGQKPTFNPMGKAWSAV
ncbi:MULTISPECIES: ribosome silencing factor [Deefgea]|uniref:Ribosomal silencing factor RsfS n=1 Tax=Deefgea piscis TaxID=2739061 RepID=A0A6M8SV20_9NEIS|nr:MULTISPECIES: ribosome silencing factor [Deefgea]MBM5574591.1 ribosome silencing factor [Deefgea sp. CFH1-16]QKJ66549.1 ribosome silencing factor [Deefgea piscis]QZA81714.1 ribosome silencing factor [Deefgea piscis]